MTTTSTSLVWLVNDDPAAAVGSRDLIRANAAAWGHRVRRQKPRARARDAALLAPDAQSDILEQPYRTLKLDIPGSSKRKQCLPPPRVPRPPSMLEDESFGLQMDHVLVRFHAIAGQIGLDWLQSVADVRDDQLVHATFKALISGLDSTTTAPARQRRCAEILPAIRKRISSPDAVHMKNMVHLIFLLSYQELLVWNNAKAWMMHISGLSAVVQTLGPQAFTTPSDLRTFQQIRLFTIPLNFFLRRSSFLETPKWQTVPWSHGVPKDLLDYVLDTLTFIPGLLGLSDQVRIEPGMTKQLDKGVAGVAHALNSWRCNRLTQYMSTLGFEDLDFEDLVERLSDGTLVDTVVAQSVVLHFSTWLFLPRIDPIYVEMLPWSTRYIIRSILNVCEEYSYHQQGMGILPWTTAIRVALFTSVGNDGTMQSWGRELCVRLERRYSVRLLSDIIASLPGAGPDEKLKFDD